MCIVRCKIRRERVEGHKANDTETSKWTDERGESRNHKSHWREWKEQRNHEKQDRSMRRR